MYSRLDVQWLVIRSAKKKKPRRHIFVRPFETKTPWFTSRNDAWVCKTSTARSFQLLFSSLPVLCRMMQNARCLEFKKDQIQKWVTCEHIGHWLSQKALEGFPFLDQGTRSTAGNWISADASTSRSRHMTLMPWSLGCKIKKPSWRLFWHVLTLDELVTDYLHLYWDGSISKVSKACFAHH